MLRVPKQSRVLRKQACILALPCDLPVYRRQLRSLTQDVGMGKFIADFLS